MQITMFKGLLPVNLPDAWFPSDAQAKIKFARSGNAQCIDFRAVGGKCLKFWMEGKEQNWAEIENPALLQWGDRPYAIESRQTVAMFGQSGKELDLTHL